MASYSDVINKASSNVARLTSISDQLNASFDSGDLSIDDYRAAMERVNAGLQKADSVMNKFQESQRGVDDEMEGYRSLFMVLIRICKICSRILLSFSRNR